MKTPSPLALIASLACTAWHLAHPLPTYASELLRQGERLPHAAQLRGGPHGPDGRPYDIDRTVRIPDAAKSATTRTSREASTGMRLVVPSPTTLTQAHEAYALAPPHIQPVYLKGCSSEDFSALASFGTSKTKQSLRLIVDSGSSTLAVASDKCRNCNVGSAYKLTGTTDQVPLQAYYGSGAWSGVVVNDAVALGFAPAQRINFGDILLQEKFFNDSNCTFGASAQSMVQGIVGVGPSDLLLPGTGSYFMSITHSLTEPTFSVALCDVDGLLYLGPPPMEVPTSAPVVTPMVPSYYYAVGLADMEVGSKPLGQSYDIFGPAVVDTGTSAIILPPKAYTAFTDAVAEASNGMLSHDFFDNGDCVQLPADLSIAELNSQLPNLGFAFYNPAKPKEPSWVSLPATNSYLMLMTDTKHHVIACAGVANSGPDYPQTILGNTMMRNMLTTFDVARGEVAFAATQNICQ